MRRQDFVVVNIDKRCVLLNCDELYLVITLHWGDYLIDLLEGKPLRWDTPRFRVSSFGLAAAKT
jgi:hypothetical protein